MRRRGGGSVYQRGGVLWIKYYRNGRPMRESVAVALHKLPGDVTEKDASGLLNKRLGAIATGQPIAPRAEKVTVDELLNGLVTEYEVNGRRSLERVKISVDHLRPVLGWDRAQSLDTARVRDYIAQRQAAGASNGTVNRELAALKRAFTLGVNDRKILTRPHIPMLREDNVRQGFFERDQFEAVRGHLPDALKPVAHFAYITGWRVSEIVRLEWRQVDFGAGTVRLEPGTTKNRDGRTFPFTPELRTLLEAQRAATATTSSKAKRIIPYVFHRDGAPIKSFRRAWLSACLAAGYAQLVSEKPRVIRTHRIFHDFRRTAVRNLERAGVPRSVAMKMVGHKTEAVYRRYAIVSDADLRAAAEKLADAAAAPARTATGTIAGTIGLAKAKTAMEAAR